MVDDEVSGVKIPKLQSAISEALGNAGDDASTQEAVQLSSGRTEEDLKREALEKEHNREQTFKDHFENVSVLALYAASIAILFLAASLFLHMVLPMTCHWLSENQLHDIKNIVTGGVLAGAVAGHLKKRL